MSSGDEDRRHRRDDGENECDREDPDLQSRFSGCGGVKFALLDELLSVPTSSYRHDEEHDDGRCGSTKSGSHYTSIPRCLEVVTAFDRRWSSGHQSTRSVRPELI